MVDHQKLEACQVLKQFREVSREDCVVGQYEGYQDDPAGASHRFGSETSSARMHVLPCFHVGSLNPKKKVCFSLLGHWKFGFPRWLALEEGVSRLTHM